MIDTHTDQHCDQKHRQTKENLLASARELFIKKGYKSTSIREITDAAGANVSAINYYFGGKENLYREVVKARAELWTSSRLKLLANHKKAKSDLEATLRAFVSEHMFAIVTKEDVPGDFELFSREISSPGPGYEIIQKVMIEPTCKALCELLIANVPSMTQAKANWCVFSLFGQMSHFVRARKVVSNISGRSYDNAMIGEMCDHIVNFSLRGILGSEERK